MKDRIIKEMRGDLMAKGDKIAKLKQKVRDLRAYIGDVAISVSNGTLHKSNA